MKWAELRSATLRSHQKDRRLSLQLDSFLLFLKIPLGAGTSPSSLSQAGITYSSLKLITSFFSSFTSPASTFPFLFTDKLHS